MPTHRELNIWRGNTEAITVAVTARSGATTTPVNLNGSTLIFNATWDGGALVKNLTITDAPAGLAQLNLTVEETRQVPAGRVASYEIERRVGAEQKTILFGRLVASGGLNTDA